MRVAPLPSVAAAVCCLSALAPLGASAQYVYSVAPTYQFSVSRPGVALNSVSQDYQSWGLMVGMAHVGSWWSPHLWLQRYTYKSLCLLPNAAVHATCSKSGWMMSVGPALRLVDHGPWWAQASADVDLGRGKGSGGAGLNVGVHWGAFIPQASARVTRFNGVYYQTFGVAVSFDLR